MNSSVKNNLHDPFSYARMSAMPGRINWHLNDLCNFKCEYCFFPYFTAENPDVGKLTPTQIVDAFDRTGRQWHIYMAGGEPMLYPNFIELVNLLKPKHPVFVSTNLFNKYTKAFANEVSPDNIITINASLHIGHHTPGTLSKFIDNYHLYRTKGFYIIVTYVTYPPLFDRMESDFEFLRKEGVEKIHALTYQGEFEGKTYPESYTREQVKMIDKYTVEKMEMFTTMNKMNFKNQPCRAGKDYFFMNIQGEMFRCGTLEGERSYGNLFEGTFVPEKESLRCTVDRCNDSCHGITSLIYPPETPGVDSDFKYSVKNKFRELKSIFTT